MDEIERPVVLPKNAETLDKYGRNYAPDVGGKILATYIIPISPLGMDTGCDVMLENFASRPCAKEEIEEASRMEAKIVDAQTPAGKRRWFRNPRELPYINDGGCQQVSVEYDATTRRVLTVVCNGEA
ncbi:hypothetical protein [Sphingosinicella xenopeptidilytica]|uniref:Uncharacterized protein n=1 Tax=Sphingosinicella xenopeptidilytica TaxID=364098 RepID=A0ABW3BYX4_SPHXN